jgi:thiol-disulfide isomerase/thioredoxin
MAQARKLIRSHLSAESEKGGKDSIFYHQAARNLRWTGVTLDSNHPSLKAKQALIDLEEAVQPSFDFALPGPDGKVRKLGEERGKVVLVSFWATWCPPCRAEMPLLARLNREWGPKGLTILAISDETPGEVNAFEGQFHYNLPVLLDTTRKVFDHYRVQGIPDTRILDRSGRVVASFGALLSEEELVKAFRAAGLE